MDLRPSAVSRGALMLKLDGHRLAISAASSLVPAELMPVEDGR